MKKLLIIVGLLLGGCGDTSSNNEPVEKPSATPVVNAPEPTTPVVEQPVEEKIYPEYLFDSSSPRVLVISSSVDYCIAESIYYTESTKPWCERMAENDADSYENYTNLYKSLVSRSHRNEQFKLDHRRCEIEASSERFHLQSKAQYRCMYAKGY